MSQIVVVRNGRALTVHTTAGGSEDRKDEPEEERFTSTRKKALYLLRMPIDKPTCIRIHHGACLLLSLFVLSFPRVHRFVHCVRR